MVTIEQMLKEAIARDASDIFLVAGHPYAFKINGEIHSMQETRLMPNAYSGNLSVCAAEYL